MFYNIPYDKLDNLKLGEIKTHSFVSKEEKLLSYVDNRLSVDVNKAIMDFSIYEKDVYERLIRIPKIKELYERKLERLAVFQNGSNIWNSKKSKYEL